MSQPSLLSSYRIVLLPSQRVVAVCISLQEAAAWMRTYNSLMAGSGKRAVIDEYVQQKAAA